VKLKKPVLVMMQLVFSGSSRHLSINNTGQISDKTQMTAVDIAEGLVIHYVDGTTRNTRVVSRRDDLETKFKEEVYMIHR